MLFTDSKSTGTIMSVVSATWMMLDFHSKVERNCPSSLNSLVRINGWIVKNTIFDIQTRPHEYKIHTISPNQLQLLEKILPVAESPPAAAARENDPTKRILS